MTIQQLWRRTGRVAFAAGIALLLNGCLLSPGTFASSLDLRKDGHFSFAYKGEIYLIALSQLSDMANKAETAKFEPEDCYDDDTYEQRECTSDELEQQRQDWADRQEHKAAEDKKNTAMFAAMMGGIDPSKPDAAEELAARLRRQAGWNSVEYKGDGLFAVDFSISSTMDRDFVFPTMERFPMANEFVIANLREGKVVRIEAPAFAAGSSTSSPMSSMMQMAAAEGAGGGAGKDAMPKLPEMNGTFTITTDGDVLSNNTDEGPQATAAGKVLTWNITARTEQPPMALIKLAD